MTTPHDSRTHAPRRTEIPNLCATTGLSADPPLACISAAVCASCQARAGHIPCGPGTASGVVWRLTGQSRRRAAGYLRSGPAGSAPLTCRAALSASFSPHTAAGGAVPAGEPAKRRSASGGYASPLPVRPRLPGLASRLLGKCFALVGSQRAVDKVVEHLEFLPRRRPIAKVCPWSSLSRGCPAGHWQ